MWYTKLTPHPCFWLLHHTPSALLGHSPSWMRTLMRRTNPHLALARNSLSSGVTTSARNMASQQSFPPAKRCSRGTDRGEGIGRTRALQNQAQIFSPVKTHKRPANKPAVNMSCTTNNLTKNCSNYWRELLSVQTCWVCLTVWEGRSLKQLGQYHVHSEGTWSPLSQI